VRDESGAYATVNTGSVGRASVRGTRAHGSKRARAGIGRPSPLTQSVTD
jgi:hypothetical protein